MIGDVRKIYPTLSQSPMKRQLSESEKQQVQDQQKEADGSLRCFISGEIITSESEVEYDHIQPFSQSGETSINNMRAVLKEFNRRKSDQSLYDVRDNLRLELICPEKNGHRILLTRGSKNAEKTIQRRVQARGSEDDNY